MPLNLRYSTSLNGNMVFTGNTLGLSQDTDLNQPGIEGNMGAFTSLNLGNQVGTFPVGTTLNYLENGSEANLTLPVGSTIVRAELIWGAIYEYDYIFVGNPEPPAFDSIVGLINDPVLFNGIPVNPDPLTAQEYTNIAAGFSTAKWYERTADVTAIVQAAGVGVYSVEQVPSLVEPISNYTIRTGHAGWTLAVVYSNPLEDYKNVYLYVGAQGITAGGTPVVDIPISGFETLPTGVVSSRLLLSTQEGDGSIQGDQALFGPTVGSLSVLSGPVNSTTNFFGGIITDSAGALDTSGTFGTRNNDTLTNTNTIAARHGWDITTVDASPYMVNSQTDAVVRITTTGDAYMVNAIGLTTNTVLLDVDLVKSVDKTIADLGEELFYSFNIMNNGNIVMGSVVLTDIIPSGTTFVGGSVEINGVIAALEDPAVGINIPDIGAGLSALVEFKVTVTSVPTPNPMPNSANLDYDYGGAAPINVLSNSVNTLVNTAILTSVKSVDLDYAEPGDRLIYSTVITNSGTVNATSIFFTDAIPIGTVFITDSVHIDTIQQIGLDPSIGFNLPNIVAGGSVLVVFEVDVIGTIPTPNPVLNANTTQYEYLVDPIDPPVVAIPEISNTVQTQVNQAIITIVKAVDKAVAEFSEVLLYTTILNNIGNVSADNVQFIDSIPAGTTFVVGSVEIDTVPDLLADPAVGIIIGSIPVLGSVTITFEVTVDNSFPPQNPIPNTSGVGYDYLVDPLDPPVGPIADVSNIVLTQINDVIIDAIKSVDLDYADVGDVITYTVIISNSGNIPAINTLFQDNIPVGTTFVTDSLTLDGITQIGADPAIGFTIPTIAIADNVIITFEVTVDSLLPIPTQVNNFATIDYPTKTPFDTNTVITELNHAELSIIKQVSETIATTGQIITYTTIITNDGNTLAENIIFTDSIPVDTTFIVDSVVINGVPALGEDPSIGINLPSLPVGLFITVSFNVQISDTIPVPNPIPNTSLVDYEYIVDPLNPIVTAPQEVSNQVLTEVKEAELVSVKVVDKDFAQWGEILLYTVDITNTGNTLAENVQIFDLIPAGTTFVVDSVDINGIDALGENPAIGIVLPDIPALDTVTVSFEVIVDNNTPVPNPIENQSTTVYEYEVDPLNSLISGAPSQSNTVLTTVNDAILQAIKTVSTNVVNLGDSFTYEIIINNIGNVIAQNIILTDLVPVGTTFDNSTVLINGVPDLLADPSLGIALPDIPSLGNIMVSFNVTVGGILPIPNPMPNTANIDFSHLVDPIDPPVNDTTQTNTVNTLVIDAGNFASFDIVKSVDREYALLGEVIKYTVTLENTGTTEALDVILNDIIPNGTTLVPDSVYIGAVQQIGADPLVGIDIGIIPINTPIIVAFEVLIDNILPVPNPMPNEASVDYKFRTNPNLDPPIDGPTTVSNLVITFVRKIEVVPTKAVNLAFANLGDVITYTVGIGNTGNSEVINTLLTDVVPSGTTFVPGTVVVGGVPDLLANPELGISIGTILPSQIILITFDVLIDNIFPVPNPIVNSAEVDYQYILDPIDPAVTDPTVITNAVTTLVNKAIIEINKIVDKAYADFSDIIRYTLEVTNLGNVDAINTVVTDIIPNGTTFIVGSVEVDGGIVPVANPALGINIPLINPGQTVVIEFDVQVGNILPIPNPIENFAVGVYEYKVDPNAANISDMTLPSNIVLTQVNHGELEIVKAVNKGFSDLSEELTYTFTIVSVGNIDSDNTILTDIVPSGTIFVPGSVIIDAIPAPLEDPVVGILIGTVSIIPIVVSFKVLVGNIIPIPNPIPNTGNIIYEYLVDPLGIPTVDSKDSNEVETLVKHAELITTKFVDKEFTGINGIITYTTTISNIGNTEAINIIFTDDIPAGTSFIIDSVKVDGVTIVAANPSIGISIPVILQGFTRVVSFEVQVNGAIPVPNPIVNSNYTDYEYIVDIINPPVVGPTSNSNSVTTLVNNASIISSKAVSKEFADLGEIIEYTIELTNIGNTTAKGVIFTDSIPIGTILVADSVYVDGIQLIGENPAAGVPIPDIVAGATSIIKFEVKIDEVIIPSPNPIPNVGITTFGFEITPLGGIVTGTPSVTNLVETLVNNATLEITKSVDSNYKDLGEIIQYSFEIYNSGNVAANNIVFKDILQIDNVFVVGSVYIDAINFPLYNPEIGFSIPSINPLDTVIVTFEASVSSIPVNDEILNKAEVDYTHIINPLDSEVPKNAESNITIVLVRHGEVLPSGVIKAANKTVTTEGDIITYTVDVTNSGNYKVENVVLADILPVGVEFILGTVRIGGVLKPVADPNFGINIGTIEAGATKVVEFKVKVKDNAPDKLINTATINYQYTVDPQNSPINGVVESNEVIVDVLIPNIVLQKSSDLQIVTIGDIITYTIIADNIGEIDVYDVIIKDLLEEDIDFIEGSVKIDGFPDITANIISGVNVGSIKIGKTKTLTFKAKVISKTNEFIDNISTAVYKYKVELDIVERIKQTQSNLNRIILEKNELTITKDADKTSVSLGDIVLYRVILSNTGNVELLNIVFKDILPLSVEFIEDSFTVNGVIVNDVDLVAGVNIGSLDVGKDAIIFYKVKVISGSVNRYITNEAFAEYSYRLSNDATGRDVTETVFVNIEVGIVSFKQLSLDKDFTIPSMKPNVEELDEVNVEIEIDNSYVVDVIKSKSNEGQILSGKKLIVHGFMKVSVEYTALVVDQAIHSAHWTVPFSSFVMLPIGYQNGQEVEVSSIIENVDADLIDCRKISLGLMILLVANIKNSDDCL